MPPLPDVPSGRRDPERPAAADPRALPLAPRALSEPHPARLPPGTPGRDEVLAAHAAALAVGAAGYADPATGLFVFTASYLAERGTCCSRGCRHCPYVDD